MIDNANTPAAEGTPGRSGGTRLWRRLGLLLLIGSLLANVGLYAWLQFVTSRSDSGTVLSEEFHSGSETATDKVAIISLEGVIMTGEGYVKQQIDAVRDDPNVKAVVLRVNSPGGLVSGSDYLHHHLVEMIQERKLPLVVSMGGLCASGGYYVAMAVGKEPDSIYAEPSTLTGSIGVIIPHYDLSGLAKEYGVEEDPITSHPLKGMGGLLRGMNEQERAIFQGLVDDMFVQFQDVVLAGRPKLTREELLKVATGQLFTTSQAKQAGLIDRVGYVEDAVARAQELAGIKTDDVRVIRYRQYKPLVDQLLFGQARARQGGLEADLRSLLDWTTPQACYLCSWLPGVEIRRGALTESFR